LQSHGWLADHAVMDSVLLPGTAFVELALHAAEQAGCPGVEDLTIHEPLILPEQGAVDLQVHVGAPDENDRRALTVYSKAVGGGGASGDGEEDAGWQRH